MEAGDIVLIGATTENPSFEVNAALLSRSKVFVLQPLTMEAVEQILRRALADRERGLGAMDINISGEAIGRSRASRTAMRERRSTCWNSPPLRRRWIPGRAADSSTCRSSSSPFSAGRCSTTKVVRSTTT